MARKKNNKTNLFINFWNGDIALVKSYWLVGVVCGAIVGFLSGMIILALGLHFDAVWGLLIPWFIYSTVGIWRSSNKYKGPTHWAILAKVFVVLGILINLSDLLRGNY